MATYRQQQQQQGTAQQISRHSSNPFDAEYDFTTTRLGSMAMNDSSNPFDALMAQTQPSHPPSRRPPLAPPAPSSASSSPTVTLSKRPTRADSKEQTQSDDSSGDDSSDDEYDDFLSSSHQASASYGPDSAAMHDDLTGRNRAVVFMETPVPVQAGIVECKLVSVDDKFEFVHSGTNKIWMRAQKRTDGLKRLNPSTYYSLWVSPLLLVANNSSSNASAKTDDDDQGVSFFDIMRELEAAEVLQQEVKRDTMLRVGKLRGTARGTIYHLWGLGKSHKRAVGAIDARPEFLSCKFERGGSALVVVPSRTAPKPRPTKKKDMLLMRAARNDPSCCKLHATKAANLWQFHEDGHDLLPRVRITRKEASEFVVEFKDISPVQAFGLAIVMAIKNSSLLSSGQSWSSLLPRRNSMRKSSLPEMRDTSFG